MNLFLTGATGFIGSHLLARLVDDGHQVVALVRGASALGRIAAHRERIALETIDTMEARALLDRYPEHRTLVHTATEYGRGRSNAEVCAANVGFPLGLLDALHGSGGGTFVNTDTCFTKNPGNYRYLRAYTLSKQHMLDWLALSAESGAVAAVNMRLEHPYGPGDAASKFVTHMIRQCIQGVETIQLTPGEQKRDFIHVNDVCDAYLRVLDGGLPPAGTLEEYQVGRGVAVSIRELMETINSICGERTRLEFGALPYRDNEIMTSAANLEALRAIGFEPGTSLRAGLTDTVAAERAILEEQL